jgi:putative endonuclease
MATTDRQDRGREGEDDALALLQRSGLVLIERNFRCTGGELDLIMRDGAHLVFVEVRRRRSRTFGGAAASITPAKQRRMRIAAQTFLLRYRQPPPCRFDIVAIDGDAVTWLKNALD